MKQVLQGFNSLLKRNKSAAIVVIDDRYEWIVEPKGTVDEFIKGIEAAVNNRYDGSCEIKKAEDFDSGYSIEVKIKVTDSFNDSFETDIYLYHGNKF